tara:strand:- start:48 stop:1046 length:999 start_codon:yes stop_codon:yes gene_type:complete
MKILFIGNAFGNSYLQLLTLRKLYKNVDKIDPSNGFGRNKVFSFLFYKFTPKLFEPMINRYVISQVKKDYDVIYVKSGEFIGKKLILILKKKTNKIVFFCNDNPFVKRDNKRWDLFLSASKFYNLIVFQDYSRIKLARKYKLKNITLVTPPYDKKIHKKIVSKNKKYDVVFVGTWSKNKAKILYSLIKLGLNIKIFGTGWNKDVNFNLMKNFVKLGHLNSKNYTKIISESKIALALYSDENYDNITARSIEIPAIGTCLLSKKTNAIKKIFKEDKEAIYFKTTQECFKKCNFYIKNSKKREIIANNASIKVRKYLKVSNEDLIKKVLKQVFL